MRTEGDTIGTMEIEDGVLYGLQTARAAANFPVSGTRTRRELMHAIVLVKRAALQTLHEVGQLEDEKAAALDAACCDALRGDYDAFFITDALQGGAGTSAHMNVCEVLCNAALVKMGHEIGQYQVLHPLDDVNRAQSTNDVYPTALRVAAIGQVRALSEACARLQESLQRRENELEAVIKMGRTELADAMPVTLGQEFGAWAQAIARDRWRIYKVEERLRMVGLGGTAVGTGATALRAYAQRVVPALRRLTGYGLARAEYPMDLTQNNDVFVEVSGLLKSLAVTLMKISGDLRLMNSRPFSEITLSPLQAGSTIMPGKVNPVLPEMVTQAAMRVMGNDQIIAIAAASGNLELNAFLPLIAEHLLDSLSLLRNACDLMRTRCIDTLTANPEACARHLDASAATAAELTRALGYDACARLIKQSGGDRDRLRALILQENLLPPDRLDALLDARRALRNET